MKTGLLDKNGNEIEIGDKVKLQLPSGEERIFEVQFKTVTRQVKNPPDFDNDFSKVNITGVVFTWMGYDLFPCVNEDGIADNEKMEIVKKKRNDGIVILAGTESNPIDWGSNGPWFD